MVAVGISVGSVRVVGVVGVTVGVAILKVARIRKKLAGISNFKAFDFRNSAALFLFFFLSVCLSLLSTFRVELTFSLLPLTLSLSSFSFFVSLSF